MLHNRADGTRSVLTRKYPNYVSLHRKGQLLIDIEKDHDVYPGREAKTSAGLLLDQKSFKKPMSAKKLLSSYAVVLVIGYLPFREQLAAQNVSRHFYGFIIPNTFLTISLKRDDEESK